MRRLVFLALLTLMLAHAPPAHARTLEDCEKIRDWHAYNLCLSSFGPRRGQRAVTGQPRAEEPEHRVYGRGGRVEQGRRALAPGLSVQRVKGGRVRATFDVGAPARRR